MNRFISLSPSALRRSAAAVAAGLWLAAGAWAQLPNPRPIPATAQLGSMQITMPPDMLINNQPARLSPGARIRAANNMLVLSGAIAGQRYIVKYLREPGGLVHDVWILNETEVSLITPADQAALNALLQPPPSRTP